MDFIWKIKKSFAATTPSGRGHLVYIETHNRDPRRERCTVLSEVGSTPLISVEHVGIVSVLVTDFVDDNPNSSLSGGGGSNSTSSTWLCVFHAEEMLDSVGRSAVGQGATILTSYPLNLSATDIAAAALATSAASSATMGNSHESGATSNGSNNAAATSVPAALFSGGSGDLVPRVSPLFGISVRAACTGITGAYIFGAPPASWKVPLATRAKSITGEWCSAAGAATSIGASTTARTTNASSSTGGFLPPFQLDGQYQQSQPQQQPGPVGCWAVLGPYTVLPVFVAINGLGPGDSISFPLEGAVVAEFLSASGCTVVAFLSKEGVLRLFAVETTTVGGDALIWHPIAGELRLCDEFPNVFCAAAEQQGEDDGGGGHGGCTAAAANAPRNIDPAAAAAIASIFSCGGGVSRCQTSKTTTRAMAAAACDSITCEALPSAADPNRYLLAVKVPISSSSPLSSVTVVETPPLFTLDSFFPLAVDSTVEGQEEENQHDDHHRHHHFDDGDGQSTRSISMHSALGSHHPYSQQQQQQQQFSGLHSERGQNSEPSSRSTSVNLNQLSNQRGLSQKHHHHHHHHHSLGSNATTTTSTAAAAASPSPNRRFTFHLVTFDARCDNIVSVFTWCPLRVSQSSHAAAAGAAAVTVAPFLVLMHGDGTLSFHGRGTGSRGARAMDRVAVLNLATTPSTAAAASAGGKSRGGGGGGDDADDDDGAAAAAAALLFDACHLSKATPLRGSYLMLHSATSLTWSVDQSLPMLAAHTIEFIALMTLRAVLPQHFDQVYRAVAAQMLARRNSSGGNRLKGTDSSFFFDTLGDLLQHPDVAATGVSYGVAASQQKQQPQLQPQRRRRIVLTPWNTNASVLAQHKIKINKSASATDPVVPALSGLTKQSLQLGAISLHLLAESLKASRFYNQQLEPLCRLVLRVAEGCQLDSYVAFYRSLLQLPPLPPASASSVQSTVNPSQQQQQQQQKHQDPENFEGKEQQQQQQQRPKSRRQIQDELKNAASKNSDGSDAAASAGINNNSSSQQQPQELALTWFDLAQFFEGISGGVGHEGQQQQQQQLLALSEPIDFMASLRWMAEGIAPPLLSWPIPRASWWLSATTFDPFRDAAAVYAFFRENTGVGATGGEHNSNGGAGGNLATTNFFPPFMTHKTQTAAAAAAGGGDGGQQQQQQEESASDIIDRVVHLGWDTHAVEVKLPAGISRPIHEAIVQCAGEQFHHHHHHQQQQQGDHHHITAEWCPEAIELIGRQDILLAAPHKLRYKQQQQQQQNYSSSSSKKGGGGGAIERRVQREAVVFVESLSRHVEACASGSTLAQIIETEAPAGPFSQVRTERILALLSASTPIPLPANIDAAEAATTTLPLLVRRAVAVALGRGMLTASTHNFRERDKVPVPPLVLTGLNSDGLVIQCEPRLISPDTMRWPTFHNACAAALRFLPLGVNNCNGSGAGGGAINVGGGGGATIPRHWIVHQARDTQHRAGVLLAVGVLGHLCSLQLTDIYSIFVAPSAQDPQREPLTIAMLLGLGCSFRRTRSEPVFRCLAVHLQTLTPNGEDVEVSLDVQSAALIALGLVFEGSAQSFLVDMLLSDISRPPSDQLSKQREGYAFASGAALGLMLLGHGRSHNLAHLGIEERLQAMLRGDKRETARPHLFRPDGVFGDVTETSAYFSQATASTSSSSGGGGGGGSSSYPSMSDEKFLTRALVTQARAEPTESCNTVSEGSHFNTQVTGPAAAVALGLMFIKTRDEHIARQLDLPSTLPLLDGVSPQLTMLRVLCAGLVRWPSDFASQFFHNSNQNNSTSRTENRAGSTKKQEEKRRVQTAVEALLPDCLVKMIPLLKTSAQARELDSQAQYRCLHLGYAHAGSALAIGMVHAGTLLADVKTFLLATLQGFAAGEVGATGVPQAMIHKKAHAFDSCLAASAIAVSLVCAGTGDPEVLRVLVGLLKKSNFTYGAYMALSSAIGLLCLGGGRCTLSNSPESVASLLLAFYPVWPATAVDNAFHLQALRHLYAMSIVPRWLSTFDVDTGRPVATSARLVMSAEAEDAPPVAVEPALNGVQSVAADFASRAQSWTPLPKGKSDSSIGADPLSQQQQQQQQQPHNMTQETHIAVGSATAFPVVTPCLLPEVATIERVEVREPGFFTLSVANSSALHTRSIGVKRKPQLLPFFFFGGGGAGGKKGRAVSTFGSTPWDAAIRDAVLAYSAAARQSSASSCCTRAVALQDIALLVGPQHCGTFSAAAAAAAAKSTGNSSSVSQQQQLVSNIRGVMEQSLVRPLFSSSTVEKNLLTAQFQHDARFSSALRFTNMHLWSPERQDQFRRLCQLCSNNNSAMGDYDDDDDQGGQSAAQLIDIATRGRFLVSVAAALMEGGGGGSSGAATRAASSSEIKTD